MYCQTCGAESTVGLKYCKRCGANLNLTANASESRRSMPGLTGMFWSIALLVLGGMSVMFGGLVGLSALRLMPEVIMAIGLVGSVTILIIASLLIWQLARLVTFTKETSTAQPARNINPYGQGEYNAPQIAAPPAVMPSVTEATTRNFEPVAGNDPAVEEKSERLR